MGTAETWDRRLGQHGTQTGLAYFVENKPNFPVTVMAELLDDKDKPPRLVPAWSSSMATCLLPALRGRYWMWYWMWSPQLCHGAPWGHRAWWKAPWCGRRRLLRVEARAHVSYKQTLPSPPTTVPTEPGGIPSAHHSHASLSHHGPPRWLHHAPQSMGMGWRRGAPHGRARSHHIPKGQLSQLAPALPRDRAHAVLPPAVPWW